MYFFCALPDITKHKLEIIWATQGCADSPVANYARWLSKSKGTLDLHIRIICFHAASLRSKYNPDLLAIRQRSPAGRRSGMLRLQLLKTKPCYHSLRTWSQQPLRCIRCHKCQPFELLFYLFTPSWVAVFCFDSWISAETGPWYLMNMSIFENGSPSGRVRPSTSSTRTTAPFVQKRCQCTLCWFGRRARDETIVNITLSQDMPGRLFNDALNHPVAVLQLD
jgi:hypothetical protein